MAHRIGRTVAFLAVLSLIGCGRPTQISAPNRRLLESLKTAVMAKNGIWLEANAAKIEAGRAEGKLSDEEFAAFDSIVRRAKADDWSGAQDEVMRLAKGQASSP